MLSTALTKIRQYWLAALAIVGMLAIGYVGYGCGQHSRDGEVSDLTTKLAENEKTVEIQNGVYATTMVSMKGLQVLLDTTQTQNAALKKQLTESQGQLLTTQQLVVQWKQAYQGALTAKQTPAGPSTTDPGVTRERVDFTKSFGPLDVSGYTLTSPPEGFITVKQDQPLKLTVAVARDKDGTWNSYVTSSDPTVSVAVTLGGVDLGILDPSWYQKIWATGGVDFLMGERASVGLSYQMDRVSVGADCSAWTGGHGCGLTVGYRLFK
jgi:hypothetical protein